VDVAAVEAVEAEEKEAEREDGGEQDEVVEKDGDGRGLKSWASESRSGEK
jgi:hypothetical protein